MKKYIFIVGLFSMFFYSCGKTTSDNVTAVSDTSIVIEKYSDGTIKTEISAIGELRQGWTRNYDQQGRLISEVHYVNNVREGTARNYYAKSGKLNSTLEFKNGIKEGDEIWYFESGQKYRVSPFRNGLIEGMQKLYYENGNIMAEVPYRAGYPGTGLKEYKQDGTLITDYPKLVIQKEDHLADANKILLRISLSNKDTRVKFYKGTLVEGKYLQKDLLLLASHDGNAQMDYNIPPGAMVNQKVTISANYKTRMGNPLILTRIYNLQVVNTR